MTKQFQDSRSKDNSAKMSIMYSVHANVSKTCMHSRNDPTLCAIRTVSTRMYLYFEIFKIFSYFHWYFENLSLLRINAAAPFEAVTRCHLVLVLHSFQIWGSKGQIHLFVLLLFLKYVFFLKTAAVFFPFCWSFSNMAKVFFFLQNSWSFFSILLLILKYG